MDWSRPEPGVDPLDNCEAIFPRATGWGILLVIAAMIVAIAAVVVVISADPALREAFAIGAIGIARAYAVAGAEGQRLWAPVTAEYALREPSAGRGDLTARGHTPVHEFAFKLGRLRERMYTESGRRLAAELHAFMAAFFERLSAEVAGEL